MEVALAEVLTVCVRVRACVCACVGMEVHSGTETPQRGFSKCALSDPVSVLLTQISEGAMDAREG